MRSMSRAAVGAVALALVAPAGGAGFTSVRKSHPTAVSNTWRGPGIIAVGVAQVAVSSPTGPVVADYGDPAGQLVYRRQTSAGWSGPRLIASDPTPPILQSVALIATATLVREVIPKGLPSGGANDIVLHYQEDTGTRLQRQMPLGPGTNPAIAVDAYGMVHVVAQTGMLGVGGDIVEWRIAPDGTLSGPFTLDRAGTGTPNYFPQVVSDGAAGVVGIWNGTGGTRWSHFIHGVWSPPSVLTSATSDGPFQLASAGGRAVYAFARGDSTDALTFMAGRWGTEELVHSGSCCGGYLAMRVDGTASVVTNDGVFTKRAGRAGWALTGPAFPSLTAYCTYTGPFVYDVLTLEGFTNPFTAGSCVVEDFRIQLPA